MNTQKNLDCKNAEWGTFKLLRSSSLGVLCLLLVGASLSEVHAQALTTQQVTERGNLSSVSADPPAASIKSPVSGFKDTTQKPVFSSALVPPRSETEPLVTTDFEKMREQGYSQSVSTPEWQAQFLRTLVGNEGILALDVPAQGNYETDKAPKSEVQDLVTLDEAVAFALQNNYELRSTFEGLKSVHWDKMGAYSQYLPTVGLDLAAGRERSRPGSYNDDNGSRVLDTHHVRRDRNFFVRQPLIDLDVVANIISTTEKEKLANYDSLDTRDTVASDTVNAYMRIVQARMSIMLADQYKNYLDNLGQRMLKRVEGGGAANADLDRIISRASIAETARVEASGQYETSILEFKRLTGIAPSRIQIPNLLAPVIPANFKDALDAAVKNNPRYLSSLKKIDIAKADRDKAYAGALPRVYAQYTSNYVYNAGGASDGNPVDGVYPYAKTDSAMMVMQWDLNGGVSIAGGLSGNAKAKQTYLQSLDILKRLEQGVSTSYTAIDATQKRLEVLQKTVEANERVVTAYEEQYKNGTRPLFDVLDSYEQLYNSRLNLLRVIFAYTQASYQVRQEMGDIVPSVLETRK